MFCSLFFLIWAGGPFSSTNLLLQISAWDWSRCWPAGVIVGVTSKKVLSQSWLRWDPLTLKSEIWNRWEVVSIENDCLPKVLKALVFFGRGLSKMCNSESIGQWLCRCGLIVPIHSYKWRRLLLLAISLAWDSCSYDLDDWLFEILKMSHVRSVSKDCTW